MKLVPMLTLLALSLPAFADLPAAVVSPQTETVILQQRDNDKPRTGTKYARETTKRLKEQEVPGMDVDSPDRWPTQIPVPGGTRLKEISAKKSGLDGYTYETKNYRFNSQVELHEDSQEAVGRLFECAYAANKAIGRVLPVPRAKGNRKVKEKFAVFLYKNMAEYNANGGPVGSAGVFASQRFMRPGESKGRRRVSKSDESSIIRDDMVKVPFESMGLNTEGHVVNKELDSHALVHELTHQCFCLNNLPVWANEGWAEYVGYVPYENEVLDFEKCFATILLNAKNKQRMLNFPFTLEDFLTMSQDEMYKYMRSTSADTYMLSTLCVSYFVHLAGRPGVKCMRDYMNELLKGVDNEKALKKLYGRLRTPEKLQKEFLKAWEEQGIKIQLKGAETE